ncbi:MAG: hypothetical protein V4671_02760, partial [Armatimonadota bacterium]
MNTSMGVAIGKFYSAWPSVPTVVFVSACLIFTSCGVCHAQTLTGKVVGPDGQPVAGAQVYRLNINTDTEEEGISSSSPRVVKTDAAGVFTIVNKPSAYSKYGIPTAIHAPGLAVASAQVKPEGENIFRLEKGQEMRGKVTDAAGKSVEGATVRLNQVYWSASSPTDFRSVWVTPDMKSLFTTKSGKDGNWTINDLPSSGKAQVYLDDERFVRLRAEADLSKADLSKTTETVKPLITRPAAFLAGRVLQADGKPAVRVAVAVFGQNHTDNSGTAVTGADGTYRVGGLSTGMVNVVVTATTKDFVAPAVEGVKATEGTAAMPAKVPDITLTAGSLLEGTVTDVVTGAGLKGVML